MPENLRMFGKQNTGLRSGSNKRFPVRQIGTELLQINHRKTNTTYFPICLSFIGPSFEG